MANKLFNQIQLKKPKRNAFDLSHDVKLSLRQGDLVPVMCKEVVPTDKFRVSQESLLRFAPMIAPAMHRYDVTFHTWFVPNRILWPDWENFINAANGGAIPAFPTLQVADANYTKLLDYFGIPSPDQGVGDEKINALPLYAYLKIYNEFYRDQNMIADVWTPALNGDNAANSSIITQLRKRAWEHDYFTSALPDPQMGAAVDIPLGEVALNPDWETEGSQPVFEGGAGTIPLGDVTQVAGGALQINAETPVAYNPDGSLQVEATSITDLRRAFKLQEWLELAMRSGRRYKEMIYAFFGIRSKDYRLDRPEYITGVKTPVVIGEVLNTTGTEERPQGDMAGHAVAVTGNNSGDYFCEEHGFIITLMSVMPKTAYQNGIEKMWLKYNDPFEYFWTQFENIGEQSILNKEVFAFNSGGAGEQTFAYIPRYSEYKFSNSRVAGDFRNTLSFWHSGRIFASLPALNNLFVEADPTNRIFAVQDGTDELWCHVYNRVMAIRPMQKFGNPYFG